MDRPIVIGVTGTHSTGKTTFLARLAGELRREHVQVATVADLGERAQRIGLPILHHHNWASTLWFLTRGMSDEIEMWLHSDVLLVDRPVPDALGYYRAALTYRNEEPEPATLAYLEAVVREHCKNYDLIFRTTLEPTIPLGDNKERDGNADFRLLADHYIRLIMHELDLAHRVLPIDGHDDALSRAVDFAMTRLAGELSP